MFPWFIKVTVTEDNGSQVAIQGGFSLEVQIIERFTKPLTDGIIVRVLDNRGVEYEE